MDQKLKARVMAEWRGFLEAPVKPSRSRSVGKILERLLPSLGLAERLDETAILQAWREIIGDFFANHSTPLRLKAGILYIQVFQPSVRYELDRTWKSQLLAKLQERFGKKIIREIRF
jgi:hypothetical protein